MAKLHIEMQRSLFLFFYLIQSICFSQIASKVFVDGVFVIEQQFQDSLALNSYLDNYIRTEVVRGYLFSGLDSVTISNDLHLIYLHKGKKLVGKELDRKNWFSKRIQRRLDHLSDHGYPFAQLTMDSIRISDGSFSWKMEEEKGPLIVNDSVIFLTPLKSKPSFIHNLIDHVPGRPFKESNYALVDRKINRIGFITVKRELDIAFQKNKAQLYLDLEEETSSSFEGIVGLQQNQQQGSNFVGNFNLDLQNLFRSGKELFLDWQSFAQGSQELLLSYKHPFIFGSRISPSFKFSLLRQDSLFLQRESEIRVATYISAKTELGFTFNRMVGSLTTTDEIVLSGQEFADFESSNYFVEIGNGRENNVILKNSSYWNSRVGIGRKTIGENPGIDDSFYDTLQLETTNFLFDVAGGMNRKLGKLTLIAQDINFRMIRNKQLLNNERFRIGGLNTVRGFNEKFFFSDLYFLSRTEFRSFFEKGSYLFAFFDQLYYQNDEIDDYAFGTGIGFSLKTSGGRFNFALALGKSEQQPLDPSNIKVHFGYTAKF